MKINQRKPSYYYCYYINIFLLIQTLWNFHKNFWRNKLTIRIIIIIKKTVSSRYYNNTSAIHYSIQCVILIIIITIKSDFGKYLDLKHIKNPDNLPIIRSVKSIRRRRHSQIMFKLFALNNSNNIPPRVHFTLNVCTYKHNVYSSLVRSNHININ